MSLRDDDEIILFSTTGQQMTVKGGFNITPYFKAKEIACQGQKVIKAHDGFLLELSFLRKRVGLPFRLNSLCRTPEHNSSDAVDGHVNSLHLTDNPKHPTSGSMAADISVRGWDMSQLTILLEAARVFGWSIGHGYQIQEGRMSGFVHLDRRVEIGLKQREFYY